MYKSNEGIYSKDRKKFRGESCKISFIIRFFNRSFLFCFWLMYLRNFMGDILIVNCLLIIWIYFIG